jgi:hypothetical protein
MLEVLVSDETVQSTRLEATASDLSPTGMMVSCSMPRELYLAMLANPRSCRVHSSRENFPDGLVGRTAWMHPQPAGEFVWVTMGLQFECLSESNERQLATFIRAVKKSGR